MNYGTMIPGGGGSSNKSLWRLQGPNPGPIELDVVQGAAAIAATLIADPRFGLYLLQQGPFKFSGGAIVSGTERYSAGVEQAGADTYSNIFYGDPVTQISHYVRVLKDMIVYRSENDSTNDSTDIKQQPGGFITTVSALPRLSQSVYTPDSVYWDFDDGIGNHGRVIIDPTGLSVVDNSGNVWFKMTFDGKLCVRGLDPVVPLTTVVALMPIYDQAGALVGHVEVKT